VPGERRVVGLARGFRNGGGVPSMVDERDDIRVFARPNFLGFTRTFYSGRLKMSRTRREIPVRLFVLTNWSFQSEN